MTQKVMGVVGGVILIMIGFILFPMLMTSVHDVQTDVMIQVEADVVTGVGETTANIVLDEANWTGDNTGITVVSDHEPDTEAIGTYTPGTKTQQITGLIAEQTRTLTLTYEYDGLTDYTGLGPMAALAPLILFVMLVFGGGFTIFSTVKGRR